MCVCSSSLTIGYNKGSEGSDPTAKRLQRAAQLLTGVIIAGLPEMDAQLGTERGRFDPINDIIHIRLAVSAGDDRTEAVPIDDHGCALVEER